MNKYLSTCVLLCVAPGAFANLGSGFYISLGVGGGILDVQELESFTLNYAELYARNGQDPTALDQAVNDAFYNTAEYSDNTANVVAGRAAIGYMWDIFEGEPVKVGNSLFKFNTTLGLEFGYRLFDDTTDTHSEVEVDDINSPPNIPPVDGGPGCTLPGTPHLVDCTILEQASSKTKLEAFDLMAVARLPFNEDYTFALLLKAGVAYNIYEVKTNINITSENGASVPPHYNNDYELDNLKHDEFLPAVAAGLEYMFSTHVGVSAEYNAIFASSHDADNQLITGNLIFRF